MTALARKPHKPAPSHDLAPGLCLPYNRAHELCGPSRHTLALMLASLSQGTILWIKLAWHPDALNAQGLVDFLPPGRITFAYPKRAEDILWCMEEALRAGCVPTVIAECDAPPSLTPVRRLHLAAETGSNLSKTPVLPLLLTPGDGGAQGVETRWHMAPQHTGDANRWMLQRRRARMAPPAAWTLDWRKRQAHVAPAPTAQVIAAE